MAHVAIIGPGAIGCVLAAWLARSGRHRVTLCARTPIEAGLRVETPDGVLVSQPEVVTHPERLSPADWAFVATKAYDAEAAAAWFPRLGPSVPVAIVQNGVEHRARFAPWLAAERCVPVMVHIPAERDAPGRVRQRGPAELVVADDAHGRALAELFAGTRVSVACTADLTSVLWRKLCLNAAGAVPALVLEPAGVLRDEAWGEVARALVRECIAVGRAEGAVLEDELVERVLDAYRSGPPDAVNSLHADRLAGRPMEVDARNGAIVRLGRKHGLPTPCNQMVVALLEHAQRARR
ncbi:MAG: 2-dehydropantoate 2-reductase [Planctomycetes bacterium]|nr:2-dehydropantoate 2-reductase [Planctomycetota bacterium]